MEITIPWKANDSLSHLAGQAASNTDWLHSLFALLPEVCTVIAMFLLLLGMSGSEKIMRMAGTSFLVGVIGVLINAAIF